MKYAHELGRIDGISPHALLVGLGLEDEAHTLGTLCLRASLDPLYLELDELTVFEVGQLPGRFSAATLQRIRGRLWKRDADVAALRSYLANPSPTAAESVAALKALIRTIKDIAT